MSRKKRTPLRRLGGARPSGRAGARRRTGTKVVAVELNEPEREAGEWEAGKLGLTKSHAILQRCQMTRSRVHFVLDRLVQHYTHYPLF